MKKQLGFTLLEIMVVVVIMGMLASIVSFNVMGSRPVLISRIVSRLLICTNWTTAVILPPSRDSRL